MIEFGRFNNGVILCGALLLLVSCGEQSQESSQTASTTSPESVLAEQAQSSAPVSTSAPTAIPFAIFPSQTRELASADVIARGETVYEGLCLACHGRDLRGGDQGGPNLLRSQVVLGDEHGELIGEVIQNGRSNPGMPEMPPLQVSSEDRVAVAEYIHSVWARQSGQGGPPSGDEIELNIVVGDAQAGETYFNEQCSGCHSISGDLQNIASKIPSAENLQNSWVAGRRWGAPNPDADPARRQVRATVTLSSGEVFSGELGRRDDFVISLILESGQYRSFSLNDNARPRVVNIEIDNPLQRHKELLSELNDEIMHNVTAYLVTLK